VANKRIRGLKRSSDFASLKNSGKKIRASDWMLVTYSRNQEKGLRFGVTIPSKVGNAVIRNRLRRWTKEFFKNQPETAPIPEVDLNVIFRPQPKDFFKNLCYQDFASSLDRAWQRIK
jgi:ribonuclease P protein component